MTKLTVAEYAALKCITVQAVYKKINNLKTVEEKQNGRKKLFIIVEDEEPKTVEDEIKPNSTDNFNPSISTSTDEDRAGSTDDFNPSISTSTPQIKPNSTGELNPALLELLQKQVQEKDKQIEEKDKQIERLQKAAEDKDKQIQEQFERFTALLMRSQELEALTHKLLLGQGETGEEPPQEADNTEEIEVEPPKPEDQEPPKKMGFFRRLFKRKKGEP